MLKELVNSLIEGNMCLIDIVGDHIQITRQLDDYSVSIDDSVIYLTDGDDRYAIDYSDTSLTKEPDEDCLSYRFGYDEQMEIYIAFPLLEAC